MVVSKAEDTQIAVRSDITGKLALIRADAVEASKGELGMYVVSDGGSKPVRWRVRPPSFVNLSVIPKLAEDAVAVDGQQLPIRFDDVGLGRVYGMEALVRVEPTERFFGWLSYSIGRSERRFARPPSSDLAGGWEVLAFNGNFGWIDGEVHRIVPNVPVLKVPHMGWNQVRHNHHPLWDGIAQDSRFYFVHSY